jgi:hypothetical protein
MTRRSLLVTLGVGLVVGGAIGYFVGRQPVAGLGLPPMVLVVNAPPVVVNPQPVIPDNPLQFEPVGFDGYGRGAWMDTKPTRVAKGMSRAEAVAILNAEGFTPPNPALVIGSAATFLAPLWQVRKPWMGGYHFVTVTFAGEKVAEVYNLWNDP